MMSVDDGDDGTDGDTPGGNGSDATEVKLGDLEALRGVVKFPVRIKCATLAWNTLSQGLDEADSA
jgi:nitrogen fixation NifU-like protein